MSTQTPTTPVPHPERPYPHHYARPTTLRDGTPVLLRAIRPDDEEMMVRFHGMLSEQSVRYRYFAWLKLGQRTAHERLEKICHVDYDRDIALVIEHTVPPGTPTGSAPGVSQPASPSEILAVGRLSKIPDTRSAEFALLVRDDQQSKGIGKLLLTTLTDIARDEHLTELTGDIIPENLEMQRLAERVGFHLVRDTEENIVRAVLKLTPPT